MQTQLSVLGPLLPRWVRSRWLLEEALRDLSPATRPVAAVATAAAAELSDTRAGVTGDDWVYRQTYLYEYGGLETFLRDAAPAALVDESDSVERWAQSSMGGYHLEGHAPAITTWTDLGTGEEVGVPALGSGVLMAPGEQAIGRLVPVEGGRMFESAPLPVAHRVARRVADDPTGWLDALRAERDAGGEVRTGGNPSGLIADVPDAVLILAVFPRVHWGSGYSDDALVASLMSSARSALAEHAGFRVPTDLISPWPCLAAATVDPLVLAAMAGAPAAADAAVLQRLGTLLAEPAAAVCRSLARAVRAVA